MFLLTITISNRLSNVCYIKKHGKKKRNKKEFEGNT